MKRKGQLKFEDRVKIENYILDEIPVSIICKKLGVSKQTIYREIRRNHIIKNANQSFGGLRCANRSKCLNKEEHKSITCRTICPNFTPCECNKLKKFPFVCNNCNKKITCREKKYYYYYYASKAQDIADKSLHDSRKGIRVSKDDFNQINDIISPLIKEKRQSLNHILTPHPEIDVSERTLRNWINNGYTNAKNIDLPRKVAFKHSKDYIHRIAKPSYVIEGRSYKDYCKFIKDHPNLLSCQLDTVIGKLNDSNKLLTIHFPSIHFQFGILIKDNSPQTINNELYK